MSADALAVDDRVIAGDPPTPEDVKLSSLRQLRRRMGNEGRVNVEGTSTA